MINLKTVLCAGVLGLGLTLPANAQQHITGHPILNGIECNELVTSGINKPANTCQQTVTEDGEFDRFINVNHHLVLNFGKGSGAGDCDYVGARVDCSGYPALHWELNLGPTSNTEQFLTKVRLSNGQVEWFDDVSFVIHGNSLIASWNGVQDGLNAHDTILAIYVVENGSRTNDEILAVAVDGIVGVNNTARVPETDCGFESQVDCNPCSAY